ncbi:MAG: STAS domain-containing protein [Acidobacteriota bacterium]|nr:STAS domain-containing protein [Acidobacteriota bacterium]
MPNEPEVPAAPLSLRIYPQDGAMVVECTGRLISGGTDELRREVKTLFPHTKRVILDLTHVTQLDSMGLGAIVSLYASAKVAGCELKLIHLSQRVREIFRVTNLLSVFEVYGEHIVKMP